MDTRQIEYILQIAEENNITHAAAKLFITQSALNQQLIKLENELGQQLFHRGKNDFRLTEAGQIYVDYARKILSLKEEAYNKLNDLANNQTGRLRIAAFRQGQDLVITVEDDGVGMDEETRLANFSASASSANTKGGYGVRNINERLHLAYGAEYGLSCESELGRGTRVTIRIPAAEETEERT